MHRWTDPLPDSLRARLDEPCVTGWGFAAGPAFAAQYRQHAETPRVLREVLTELFARRMSFKRAHVDLDRVISAFPDLAAGTEDCPRACSHDEPDCALNAWADDQELGVRERLASMRRLLAGRSANPEGFD